ncbi:MAG: phosphoglycerate kinase [Dehalococcoidales bacterium]|nr:MAG: phosphoglycerate kinase [Dehalococcoidales bacterium]
MNKLSVRDVDVSSKRVLVRVDFNVPLDERTGAITDDGRILAALPTIRYLIDQGARVILASHLGRPDGKVDEKLRMTVVAQRLSQILNQSVEAIRDCIGAEAEESVANLKSGDVILLENLRFYAAEEDNDPLFAQELAKLADIFVDDAFGTAHRSHTSIVGVTKHLPAVAGLLLEKELRMLGGILDSPTHPFAALLGGAKVSDKVAMVENIMGKVDCILIGGGMAATFLKASNREVGLSLIEEEMLDTAADLMEKATRSGVRIMLPDDVLVANEINTKATFKVVPVEAIPANMRIADIGPWSVKSFSEELRGCKTIFWNGPMGVYEIPIFAEGTLALAKLLAGSQATTVIGGGSTAEAVTHIGLADKMTFVSTGGGASLQFLSGKSLPGVDALLDRDNPVSS